MCRCILFNSVLQLTPVKHRRRTHTQRSMWGGGLMLLQLPLGSVGWITNTHLLHHMGILAIPRHPSINSLSLPSVTRGIKHPSLLTTHTVRTKPWPAETLPRCVFKRCGCQKRERVSCLLFRWCFAQKGLEAVYRSFCLECKCPYCVWVYV